MRTRKGYGAAAEDGIVHLLDIIERYSKPQASRGSSVFVLVFMFAVCLSVASAKFNGRVALERTIMSLSLL